MDLHKASAIILTKRLRFAGHCWRNKKLANDLLFWNLSTEKDREAGQQ